MSLLRNRTTCFVDDVKKVDNKKPAMWTVVVHLVEIHTSSTGQPNADGKRKRYKRLLFVDERGRKVSGVLFDNDINYFSAKLKAGKRYMISNAKLSPAYGHFQVSSYEYTWTITHETPVEPIHESVTPPFPFSYDTCPYTRFQELADKDVGINVKGVAVHVFPVKQITKECRKREIVIIDESKIPVILALVGDFADQEGLEIANNIHQTPLIMAVNVRATTYHSISLSTRMYSCILVNPPLSDAATTKDWYRQNKTLVTQMVTNKMYADIDLHLPRPELSQIIKVPAGASTIVDERTAWVSGLLRFTARSNEQYYNTCCANCHKKANAGHDWYMQCSSCGEEGEMELRCSVPLDITGDGQTIQILLTTPDVEMLTGITPEQLKDSHEFDFGVEKTLEEKLNGLHVVCFLKRFDPSEHGSRRGPGLRFPSGKTYKFEDIQKKDLPGQLLLENTEEVTENAQPLEHTPPVSSKLSVNTSAKSQEEIQAVPSNAKRTLDLSSKDMVTTTNVPMKKLCQEEQPKTVIKAEDKTNGSVIKSTGSKKPEV